MSFGITITVLLSGDIPKKTKNSPLGKPKGAFNNEYNGILEKYTEYHIFLHSSTKIAQLTKKKFNDKIRGQIYSSERKNYEK